MRDARCVKRTWVVVLVAVMVSGVFACSSDNDGSGSTFRNLGKRGDSSVTSGHAALK